MFKINPVVTRFVLLLSVVLAVVGCSSNDTASSGTSTQLSAPATWFIPDGSGLTATQKTTLFDTNQLYFNVKSAAHSTGEIRGELVASAETFPTDAGDPFAPNPANNPITFSTILDGDQVKPRNVITAAKGYGSVTFNPVTKLITGYIVTSGLSGTAARISDGLSGVAGTSVLVLEGGPVVWNIPAQTHLTDAQIARLGVGAYYFSVTSDAFPDGELRGQLDRQVRCAALTGASEVPSVATSAAGVGFLALKASTRQFSGFVKVAGINSTITAIFLQNGSAGTNGPPLVTLENRGNGIWALPINSTLGDVQVANFNNDELYFNVHTVDHISGEVRGQILKTTITTGTAILAGAKEVPSVSSPGSGAGTIAWNSVTGQISGSVRSDGFVAEAAQIQSGSATTSGPALIDLTSASPVLVTPTPGISFALDIQPIFTASCSSVVCHVTGGIAPMSLQPGLAYANTIIRVVPGNSTESLLIKRLTGVILPQMPLAGPPLSATSLNLIKAWIDNGALDN